MDEGKFNAAGAGEGGEPLRWLFSEFRRRKSRNPRYSLRAFSRSTGIAPGRLSEYLNRRRALTEEAGCRIARNLGFSPAETQKFLESIDSERAGKWRANPTGLSSQFQEPFHSLTEDSYAVIADWYHFAILSLVEVEGFQPEPRWISERLGISSVEACEAMDRLLRLGLLEVRGTKTLKTNKNVATSNDVISAAVRKSHRQLLELSSKALEDVPIDERDVSAMTMAIDPARLPEAKILIQRFRRHLCSILEASPKKKEVYSLNIQLVPLSKRKKK